MASKRPPSGLFASVLLGLFFYFCYIVYVILYCGLLLENVASTWIRITFVITWHIFWTMSIWCVFTLSLSNIKVPSRRYHLPISLQELLRSTEKEERQKILLDFVHENKLNVSPRLKKLEGGNQIKTVDFCQHCQAIQPERAYHCECCKSCILRMDHHCFLIGTCINFANFKAYNLSMLYLWCLGVTTAATMGPFLPSLWKSAIENDVVSQIVLVSICTGVGVYIAASSLCSIGGFLFILFFFAGRNMSMTEESKKKDIPNYNLGSFGANFKQFYGERWYLWPFPLQTAIGDGYTFPVYTGGVKKEDHVE